METVKPAISFRDIERRVQARTRGEVSQPSTLSMAQDLTNRFLRARIEAEYRIDYAEGRLAWVEPWMLDPEDTYPFVEWDDLDTRERAWVITKRVAWQIERLKTPLEDLALSSLTHDLEAIPAKHDDQMDAMRAAAERYREALDESDRIRKTISTNPQPARKGHLMAEGGVLARVRAGLKDGSAYERKVTFHEPVAAFTMLHGDRIAVGGDMLTACTTRDTIEATVTDHAGRPKTIYTSKAVSI